MNELAQRSLGCSVTLLPYNATQFERDVESAIKYNCNATILSGFKFNNNSGVLNLALSWEYSLSQINVEDFRQRIIQGLQFHRFRGTPYSLRLAFSWYGFENIKIEEEVPGEHFSEFQIGLQEIPNNLDVEKIISVSEAASPLRSRLSRMYNDLYDVRRFVLNESDWGDFLSDHSGNQLYTGSPKFSFGRVNNYEATIPQPTFENYVMQVRYIFAKNNDTYKLDWVVLDEDDCGTLNYDLMRKAYRFIYNSDRPCDKMRDVFESRKIAKASITLSEDAVLENINTCFSCGYTSVTEQPFELSYHYLSELPTEREQILIANREFRSTTNYAENNFEIIASRGNKNNVTFFNCAHTFSVESYHVAYRISETEYPGNNMWHDQQHFDASWNDQANYLGRII